MIDWVPIVVGIVGFIVGWIIRIVWEKRKLELEHKLQIMREMTKTFHDLSLRHYNPLAQAAYDLKRTLAQGESRSSSFFRLAKFWRQYEKVPILQLRCSLAEDTFVVVAGKIRTVMSDIGKFSEEDFARLQEEDIGQKLADFGANIQANAQLRHVFNKYTRLARQRENELEDLMQCLSDIIVMEVSCGKEPWYKREELCKQAHETLARFNGLTHIDNDIRSEVTKYYQRLIETYQKRWYQKAKKD